MQYRFGVYFGTEIMQYLEQWNNLSYSGRSWWWSDAWWIQTRTPEQSGIRIQSKYSRIQIRIFLHLSYPETRDSHWVLQLSKTNNALAQGKKIFTNITLSKTLLRELFYFKPNFVNLTIIHPHERISPELVRCIVSLELKYTSKVYII